MKILIVGGGIMGHTYVEAFIKNHVAPKAHIYILDKNESKRYAFSSLGISHVYGSCDSYITNVDLVILAIKPQDFFSISSELKQYLKKDQLILSIMAGVSTSHITDSLNTKNIIRAMPNIPAMIGRGMTVYTAQDSVTREELTQVQNILNSTGKTLYVKSEEMIDAATAISGTGPAYVYFLMDQMIKSAIDMGFDEHQAEVLVSQTFYGAISLYNKSNEAPAEWIKKVSSKGGTTEAAFDRLDKDKTGDLIQQAIHAAKTRATELSE